MKTNTTILFALALSWLPLAASETAKSIPIDQLGATADQQSKDSGTGITPTASGAKLRAVMQDLEAEATPEGLWLTSVADEDAGKPNRFRIRAMAAGRQGQISTRFDERGTVRATHEIATFLRPGLAEEYSVSTDGVRQDFLVHERPAGAGELNVELKITGAKAEAADFGAKLTLDGSGRELAYSRLKVTDATGRELAARMVVDAADRVQVVVNDIAAAYPVRVDPTFSDLDWISMGQLPGTSGPVYALAADESGNLYVGGSFSPAGGVASTNYIAKWNGSIWSAMGAGTNSTVYAIDTSGTDVYVGGDFTVAGGVAANYIAKWNGSVWSALGSGTNGGVRSVAVSGANVYVGGFFSLAGGVTNTANIARWSGTAWFAMGTGTNSTVSAIDVSGSNVYVGGGFSLAGGVTNTVRIARWDGAAWFAMGTGANGSVSAIKVSGSNVYVGGGFTSAGGVANTTYIARWDGTAWNAMGSGTNNSVSAIDVSGSNVYVGGGFGLAGGVANTSTIARWDGTAWNAMSTGTDSTVNAIAVSGSDVYAGGFFSVAGATPGVNYIAKWSANTWTAVGSGLNGNVYAAASNVSDLYVGGEFTLAGGIVVNRIAKWNGSAWSALGTGGAAGGTVTAIAVLGPDVYVGGSFTSVGGASNTSNIAKWTGTSWIGLSTGTNSGVNALAVSGSDLYVGGNFTSAGGLSNTACIARWNGNNWSSMGTGMNGGVLCLATSGTDVYAGGAFTSAGGVSASNIARWNGSAWSALGTGANITVRALAVSGTDLYAGGDFTLAGGVSNTSYIAKWNGSAWSALGTGVNQRVYSIAVNSTNVFAGGEFTAAGLGAANRIAMWNGLSWQPLGSGLSSTVRTLSLTGNTMFVGGSFQTAPTHSPYLVKADVSSINRFPLVLTNTGSGSVTASPAAVDYVPGTPVTLTAVPALGFALTSWSGDVATSGNPITITMDRYRAITANFGPSLPLTTALDGADIVYTSGGTASWYGQAPITHDGIDAARSGAITNNQESWFETTVTGPGLLSFWWRVSSEANYDFLEFYIDGALQNGRISGESGWQLKTFTVFTGTHTLRWRYAKDKTGSAGTDSAFVDEINWSPDGLAMPLVLDQYGLPFTRGGTTPWFGESTISHDGVDAAQSGAIDNNQQTWLQALAVGPGTLSFWWKVSSEVNYDFLEFYINDVLQTGRISGEVDWQQQTYSVLDGAHSFRWVYSKDRDTSAGLDTAWLDQVVWTTSVQSSFAAWSSNYFSAVELAEPLVSGPNANADGDSLVNLLEFALGGNPKQGNSAPVPVLSLSAESKPQLTFSCDTSRTGITYRVQYSTDFAVWNDIATSVNGGRTLPVGALSTVSDTATGIRNVTVTYQNSTTTQPTVFLRLTVNQP